MFDTVDRIINLDIGKRGVDKLYDPARSRSDEALSAAAARKLTKLAAGDRVIRIYRLAYSPLGFDEYWRNGRSRWHRRAGAKP